MTQQEEPEMGRFKPKGGKNEPNEPFFPDEMLEPSHGSKAPSISGLHSIDTPLTKDKLKVFLTELKPIVSEIQQMSRKDQHLVGAILQEVKNKLPAANFSEEILHEFEDISVHFNQLLTRSEPDDRDAVLNHIENLQSKL